MLSVQEKFSNLAAEVLPSERLKRAARALWEFDQLSDAKELQSLLSI